MSPSIRSPVFMEVSPSWQPSVVRPQGSRAGSGDTSTTTESPPLPPSPSQFHWQTRATRLHDQPSSALAPACDATSAASAQATDNLWRPCDWIDCPFCPAATRGGFGGVLYKRVGASTVRRDSLHDRFLGGWSAARGICTQPLATSLGCDRDLNVSNEASTRRKKTTSRRRYTRFEGACARGGNTKQAPPSTGDGRSYERIGWSVYEQEGSGISSRDLLAVETHQSPSGQDENSEEFWEVATLLGLMRST